MLIAPKRLPRHGQGRLLSLLWRRSEIAVSPKMMGVIGCRTERLAGSWWAGDSVCMDGSVGKGVGNVVFSMTEAACKFWIHAHCGAIFPLKVHPGPDWPDLKLFLSASQSLSDFFAFFFPLTAPFLLLFCCFLGFAFSSGVKFDFQFYRTRRQKSGTMN